jgi:hypothetical protein
MEGRCGATLPGPFQFLSWFPRRLPAFAEHSPRADAAAGVLRDFRCSWTAAPNHSGAFLLAMYPFCALCAVLVRESADDLSLLVDAEGHTAPSARGQDHGPAAVLVNDPAGAASSNGHCAHHHVAGVDVPYFGEGRVRHLKERPVLTVRRVRCTGPVSAGTCSGYNLFSTGGLYG